ncbi:MAG TPA: ParB/RepB/Spo0J family partition protein [Candidatus Krumholzibacterium sp.]|nr:ParB/RepB/Spo0J family partition protein [Candidatus Krumholzibacterium sp.]
MRKKVLGRGLQALISQDLKESVSETERIAEIPLEEIDPNPFQPRGSFDRTQLEHLADSIRKNGVLQPVVVRRRGERYQIVVGERRMRASGIAGKHSIPAIVREVSDDDALKLALLENLQREDLNPVEEAKGYVALKDTAGMSDKDIAEALGKDRSTVANMIRLLALPAEVIALLEEGKIRAGHARAILSIKDPGEQILWARRAAEDGFTVRDVEDAVKPQGGRKRKRSKKKTDPALALLEERAETLLGTRVRIASRNKGGVITIDFYSDEDLIGVLERMGVETTL